MGIILLVLSLQERLWTYIRFQDSTVIACAVGASEILAFPLLATIVFPYGIFIVYYWSKRTPILGKTGISYGQYPWDDSYPLFWGGRPKRERTAGDIGMRKLLLKLFLFILILGLVLYPASLFVRDSLESDPDACLVHYNFMNRRSAVYAVDDVASLTIASDWIDDDYAGLQWGYTATLHTEDGQRFHFTSLSDRSPYLANSQDAMLEILLEIKAALPPDAVTIEGKEDVDSILGTMGPEHYLLLELFDVPYTFG